MRFLSVIFILFSLSLYGQNCLQEDIHKPSELIGIWQADNNEDGSAWPDVYRFFDNKKFIFNPNQYDGLKRIFAINGTYRIVENKLYLKVISTTEIEGGHIVRSTITTLSDSWEIVGGKEKEVKQRNKDEEFIEIQQCNNDISKESCIILDGRKYYKMQNDPSKY